MKIIILILSCVTFSCSETELIGGGKTVSSSSADNSKWDTGDSQKIEPFDGVGSDFGDGKETEAPNYSDQLIRGEGFDQMNKECVGSNLVKNSDFELGYSDFTTEYTWQTTPNSGYLPGPERHITINSNPKANHSGYTNHAEDSGKMLVINLSGTVLPL